MEESLAKLVTSRRCWYLLWAPAGFGGTTARITQVQEIVREFDKEGLVWYPLRQEVISGRTYMKALYPGYMMIRCQWSQGLEDMLVERLPAYALFLKDVDTLAPIPVAEGDIIEVNKVLDELLNNPELFVNSNLKIGMDVKVLKRSFYGQIGKVAGFLPRGRVNVELSLFGRTVPVSFEARDLQPL